VPSDRARQRRPPAALPRPRGRLNPRRGLARRPRDLRHLSAAAERTLGATLLADAGLNRNNGAFKNLAAAADVTGFLSRRGLIWEVYPATVRKDHLDFLRSVGNPYVGVGLQPFDSAVLAGVERKYDEARFEQTLQSLTEAASVAVEVIRASPATTLKVSGAIMDARAGCRAPGVSTTVLCCPRP
jgi:hypothetical protein